MQIVEVPEQEMKAGDVMIRLQYVGFCGSDLNTYLGRNPMVKLPVIPGHEVGAVIEAVGTGVPENLNVLCVISVGYKDEERKNYDLEKLLYNKIHYERF